MDKPNLEVIEDKDAIREQIKRQVDEYLRKGGSVKIAKPIRSIADLSEPELEILRNRIEWKKTIELIEIR